MSLDILSNYLPPLISILLLLVSMLVLANIYIMYKYGTNKKVTTLLSVVFLTGSFFLWIGLIIFN